jgi:hypothetical protein
MLKEISDFHPSFYSKTISHPDYHQHRASVRLHFTDTSNSRRLSLYIAIFTFAVKINIAHG